MTFDQTIADRFAGIALGHVSRPFPYFAAHCMLDAEFLCSWLLDACSAYTQLS